MRRSRAPVAFDGVLIWQEVMNFRSTRRNRAGADLVRPDRRPASLDRAVAGGPNDRSLAR